MTILLEFFLAAWLATFIHGLSNTAAVVPVDVHDSAVCQARAAGIADGLSSSRSGSWHPLLQAGVQINPTSLDGHGCQIAITSDPLTPADFDGFERVGGIGPNRAMVVWKNNDEAE